MPSLKAGKIYSRGGEAADIEGGASSDSENENALDKLDKKEEKTERRKSDDDKDDSDKEEKVEKKKKKSKLSTGIKNVGKLVKGFIHFIDQAVEGTIDTVTSISESAKSSKKANVEKLKEVVEERAAKAEIHYAIPLYDVIVKNLYDKLGWMLLAKKLGKYEKVQMYKNEIKDTLESMKNLAPVVSPKEKEALNMHYKRLLILYEESRILL